MYYYREINEEALDDLKVGEKVDILWIPSFSSTAGSLARSTIYTPLPQEHTPYWERHGSGIFWTLRGGLYKDQIVISKRTKRTIEFTRLDEELPNTRTIRYADWKDCYRSMSKYRLVKRVDVLDWSGDDDDCI